MKVLGVAPGADVDVMKVFGDTNIGFTSEILQGIDWAIQQDHVDILSMSFGSAPLPNTAAGQPLTAILKNAMSDGIVVVASTGDSSPSNTEGSPALDPGVIGAAASTSYRVFAQTNSVPLSTSPRPFTRGAARPRTSSGRALPAGSTTRSRRCPARA